MPRAVYGHKSVNHGELARTIVRDVAAINGERDSMRRRLTNVRQVASFRSAHRTTRAR